MDTPEAASLRLIDANANRAREGIRTAEDYIRFNVQSAPWALKLKALRASITTVINRHFDAGELLASRNVPGDPGQPSAAPHAPTEASTESAQNVARRGLKRAQEALRVLEEYLRSRFPDSFAELSQARYTLYDAEQWLVLSSTAAAIVGESTVYVLLTESLCRNGLMPTARAVLKGGCKLLQLREKTGSNQGQLGKARDLQSLCNEYNAVLICNDRVDIALLSGAAGVHVGQEDLAPAEIRRVAGQRLIVGRSTHSLEQARRALETEPTDYIAIGSMYDTSTKPERIMAGLTLAQQVSALNTELPVFAIGGITLERIGELKAAGVRRIAVSSEVIAAADPQSATARLIERLKQA